MSIIAELNYKHYELTCQLLALEKTIKLFSATPPTEDRAAPAQSPQPSPPAPSRPKAAVRAGPSPSRPTGKRPANKSVGRTSDTSIAATVREVCTTIAEPFGLNDISIILRTHSNTKGKDHRLVKLSASKALSALVKCKHLVRHGSGTASVYRRSAEYPGAVVAELHRQIRAEIQPAIDAKQRAISGLAPEE